MNLERSHIQSQHIKVNLTSVFRQWTIGIWSFLKSKIYYQVKTYEAQAGLTEHVQGLYSESRQTIKHSKASEDCPRGTEDKNLPTSAGDMVWSLGQEDSACHGATKPVHQNYWACRPLLLKLVRLELLLHKWEGLVQPLSSLCSLQLGKAHRHQ